MIRFIPWIFAMLLFAAGPVLADQQVMELLRLSVPADQRDVWMDGERSTWQPWLEEQDGFLGREIFWDAARAEGLVLVRWASREQWKAISDEEVQRLQGRFDARVNTALGRRSDDASPFPLVEATELHPQRLSD